MEGMESVIGLTGKLLFTNEVKPVNAEPSTEYLSGDCVVAL